MQFGMNTKKTLVVYGNILLQTKCLWKSNCSG